jgi:hypothetical protein
MTALPTPKLADLDDPLAPRRERGPAAVPAPARPATRRRRTPPDGATPKETSAPPTAAPTPTVAPSLADEQLVAVFARIPESLSDRLVEGVRALNAGRPRRGRVSQQELLGALVERYVTPDAPAALSELVDAYRQRIRR